ncbi:MAG TPA: hypothetical protein VFG47_21685 [Geminicoccaceae bacterium]|nr:hypothetical protein [Geminicoccaceae bacterium]
MADERSFRPLESLDRRVLGAVRLLDDVTRAPIARPLTVAADGVRFLRNRQGLYVISDAPGLGQLTRLFELPADGAALPPRSFVLRIEDPLQEYLPRLATLELPRAATGDPPPLFTPLEVAMLPAPAAGTRAGWGGLHAHVERAGDRRPVRGALVRLAWSGTDGRDVVSRGLSDERGEALVPVAGLPVSRLGEGEGADVTDETFAVLALHVADGLPWPVDPDPPEPPPGRAVEVLPAAALAPPREPPEGGEIRLRLRPGRLEPVTLRVTL